MNLGLLHVISSDNLNNESWTFACDFIRYLYFKDANMSGLFIILVRQNIMPFEFKNIKRKIPKSQKVINIASNGVKVATRIIPVKCCLQCCWVCTGWLVPMLMVTCFDDGGF